MEISQLLTHFAVPLDPSAFLLLRPLSAQVIRFTGRLVRNRKQNNLLLKKVGQQNLIILSAILTIIVTNIVIPVIGEVDNPAGWIDIVKELDAVIECVGGFADMKTVSEEILLAVSKAAKKLRPEGSPKLTYIYTSGTWVHGDDRNKIITDTTPLTPTNELVTWRPNREQEVIKDANLNGIVIRPTLVVGRSGSLLAPYFKSASKGTVWYPGEPGGRFAVVHVDDLADLYVRVVEKATITGGLIFDAANDQTESVDDVLAALVKVSGAQKPYEYRKPANGMLSPL